jgi:hypothetical protein
MYKDHFILAKSTTGKKKKKTQLSKNPTTNHGSKQTMGDDTCLKDAGMQMVQQYLVYLN